MKNLTVSEKRRLGCVTVVVRDYAEAMGFYCGVLGFEVVEDREMGKGKRFVVVRMKGSETGLVLAKAGNEEQMKRVGDQTGGRVFLFLETDDFWRDYGVYKGKGVVFLEEPRVEGYGTVAVFLDLYGNRWDLIERSA